MLAIAWKAQQRLHHVWRRLDVKRGKRRTIIAVAVARHLAGFCWPSSAIPTHPPAARAGGAQMRIRRHIEALSGPAWETETGGRRV